MSKELENYVSDDGEYIIPITWECYGTIQITGVKNLKEAMEVAKRYKDDLPIPTNGDYIDGSFKLNFEEDGEESLINAQSFAKYDATFKNPKAEE